MTKIVYQDKYDNISHQQPTEHYPASNMNNGWDETIEADGGPSLDQGGLGDLQNQTGRPGPQDPNVEGEMQDWINQQTQNSKPAPTDTTGNATDPQETQGNGEFTLKHGVRYYSSKDPDKGKGYDFDLNLTGDNVRSVIDTEGNVILNLSKTDKATITQSGSKLTVLMGRERVEIDLDKCQGVHFVGGQVSGDVDNEDKKITTDQGAFLSDSEISRVKGIISGAPDKFGASDNSPGATYKIGYGDGHDPDGAHQASDTAKAFFAAMSTAMDEQDPKKQKDLWNDATDVLQGFIDSDSKGGYANNLGHFVGNILLSEFGGKEGLLKVFEEGLIPPKVASLISVALKDRPDENGALSDVTDYQQGGLAANMTHAELALIFDRASKASDSS